MQFPFPALNMDRPVCGEDGVTVRIFRNIRIKVDVFLFY